MKAFNHFNLRKIGSLLFILVIAPILNSCVVTDDYYGGSSGSYYGGSGYASGYRGYGSPSRYDRSYYGDNDYRYDSHRHDPRQYNQRDSRTYHSAAGRDHHHPQTTSSDKFRIVNYHEDKKKSHPSGYHDADYWKSRGYSVKKNTFEKKDGKIVGSRKDLKKH